MKEDKTKVNAEVSTKIHARFKSHCAAKRLSMGEVLERLMELYLQGKVKI